MKRTVYADNAATTSLCESAKKEITEFLNDGFYNPSSTYTRAVEVRSSINRARDVIAGLIGAKPSEIIFTAGGAEADSLALVGYMEANKEKGRHIITTSIEHHAVLEACASLRQKGFCVTYVNPDENGVISLDDIEAAVRPDTILVSVMYINNETGATAPISEIGEFCRRSGICFHTDAVQAFGKVPVNVNDLNADMLSVSAHKFHGPKGAGFLYVKSDIKLNPIIFGGSQEDGRRGGTENVPGIMGMVAAAKESVAGEEEGLRILTGLRDYLWKKISEGLSGIKLNSDLRHSFPGILNLSVEGVEGQSLLIMLDMKGVYASTGSACAIALSKPSHVLKAMGRTDEEARASLRLSFDSSNTTEDMDFVYDAIKESVEYLRKIRGY